MATNPRQMERETAEAGHEATRKAAEQTSQISRTMADAGERSARAGTEAMQHNVEALGKTWQTSSEAASRIAERSMDQFSKMFGLSGDSVRQSLEQSSGNMKAVMESTTVVASGLQNLSGEWIRFAQSRVEQNLDSLDRLMECRSFHDCLTLQTDIARDNLEALLHSTKRASELSTQIADEAIRRMGNPSLVPR